MLAQPVSLRPSPLLLCSAHRRARLWCGICCQRLLHQCGSGSYTCIVTCGWPLWERVHASDMPSFVHLSAGVGIALAHHIQHLSRILKQHKFMPQPCCTLVLMLFVNRGSTAELFTSKQQPVIASWLTHGACNSHNFRSTFSCIAWMRMWGFRLPAHYQTTIHHARVSFNFSPTSCVCRAWTRMWGIRLAVQHPLLWRGSWA